MNLNQLIQKHDLISLINLLESISIDWISYSKENSNQDSPLHLAVRNGNIQSIKILLKFGCSVCMELQNGDGKRALHEAALKDDSSFAELLLENGAIIDSLKRADWTPLMLASSKGHLDVIKLLISWGANVSILNKDGWSAFHIACRAGDPDVIKYFLSIVDTIWNTKSRNGRTPLHTAALNGRVAIIEILLEYGSYPYNEKDACGSTPVMDAIRSGNVDSAQVLMDHHSHSLEIEDKMGATALHFASREGHTSIVQLLVNNGILVDEFDSSGRTALWLAGSSRKTDCFHLLRSLGASTIADNRGIDPLNFILN